MHHCLPGGTPWCGPSQSARWWTNSVPSLIQNSLVDLKAGQFWAPKSNIHRESKASATLRSLGRHRRSTTNLGNRSIIVKMYLFAWVVSCSDAYPAKTLIARIFPVSLVGIGFSFAVYRKRCGICRRYVRFPR